jgi:Cft2 family RNA processing exonuclease
MSALTIEFSHGGVRLPRLGLWLDPHRAQRGPERVFVSHAHADHTAPHREVILTDATARLMRTRIGGQRSEHILPFGEPRDFAGPEGAFRLTLLPAGHILGSAMILIEADGESLLYTGDFKLQPGFAAEPCAPRHTDALVMETTFGRPEYVFPPADTVMAAVVAFCRVTLAAGVTPVLLAYSLGKSQELLAGLAGADLPLALDESVWKMTKIYQECGWHFPAHERLGHAGAQGKVLICPPQLAHAAARMAGGPVRTAIVSGWAVEPGCRFRYGADAAFPLSDHADFPDLIAFVQRVAPRRVFTLHGFAADFAAGLRDRGYDARALSEAEQLTLALGLMRLAPALRSV